MVWSPAGDSLLEIQALTVGLGMGQQSFCSPSSQSPSISKPLQQPMGQEKSALVSCSAYDGVWRRIFMGPKLGITG